MKVPLKTLSRWRLSNAFDAVPARCVWLPTSAPDVLASMPIVVFRLNGKSIRPSAYVVRPPMGGPRYGMSLAPSVWFDTPNAPPTTVWAIESAVQQSTSDATRMAVRILAEYHRLPRRQR